jgi:hypothetical protein
LRALRIRPVVVDLAQIGGHAAVGSATGAVPALPRVRFPWPPSEPDVRLSPHPALHGDLPVDWFRQPPRGWGLRCPGSGSAEWAP